TICFVALTALASIGGPASALASGAPSQPHSYRTVIRLSGDEYSDAQGNVLNNPRRGKCPPPPSAAVPSGCWTWAANRLGHGTYTVGQPNLQGTQLVWTFSLTDTRGDSLTGNLTEHFSPDPSPSDALTHANRDPPTPATRSPPTHPFTAGSGRFVGVTGVLTAATTTTTVDVAPATGAAHTKFTSASTGTLTFPSKL